mmetsp:Transcript_83730/g.167699  ORF Transcript_83730/g.167699 Transcript_83730/m.167699 type:complete len:206 (+) Transcript_83730:261-878(+)
MFRSCFLFMVLSLCVLVMVCMVVPRISLAWRIACRSSRCLRAAAFSLRFASFSSFSSALISCFSSFRRLRSSQPMALPACLSLRINVDAFGWLVRFQPRLLMLRPLLTWSPDLTTTEKESAASGVLAPSPPAAAAFSLAAEVALAAASIRDSAKSPTMQGRLVGGTPLLFSANSSDELTLLTAEMVAATTVTTEASTRVPPTGSE